MAFKRLAVGTVAAGGSMWILAGLWHELVAAKFYAEQTSAEHEGTAIILAAYLVLGLLMASLYPRWYTSGRGAVEGLKFGAIMGVLWVFPHELAMAGAHGDSLAYVFQNAAWHIAEQGVGGMVLGLLHPSQLRAAAKP